MTGNGGNQNNNIFVYGKPYMILSSTRSKCFSVMAPHDQVLKIEYDAPGKFSSVPVLSIFCVCVLVEMINTVPRIKLND